MPAPPFAPVARGERLEILDVLRGFALSGILFVNIETLSGHDFLSAEQARALPGGGLDPLMSFLVSWLVHAKFYSLFSLLFGIGFAVFMQRAAARGVPAAPLFRRRLFGLLLIGLLHSVLLWFGDILHVYALVGFLLVPFYSASPRKILRWSAIVLVLPIVLHGLLVVGAALAPAGATGAADSSRPDLLVRAVEAYRAGGYLEVLRANAVLTVVGFVLRRVLQMQALRVYGMFLLGFYISRRGLLEVARDRAMLRRSVVWGLALGLPASAAAAVLPTPRLVPEPTFVAWAQTTSESIGALGLCLAYAAAIVLLFERPSWRRWLASLSSFGRTALTNYLLQTLACVAVFYGIGFGLFMRVSLAYAFLFAIAIITCQLVASPLWLARFAYGPAEYGWRRFTYARVPGGAVAGSGG